MTVGTDRFRYYRTEHLAGVTLLDAAITDFRYKRHTHDDYSIAITRQGYQSFFCAGSNFRVPRGGIIQINPDALHDGFAEDRLGFHYSILYLPQAQVRAVQDTLGAGGGRVLRFQETVLDHALLRRQLLALMRAVMAQGREAMEVQERLHRLIETLLAMNGHGTSPARSGRGRDALIARARDYLHDHLHEAVSLDAMAAALNVSKFHLARRFKDQVGSTPYRYLLDCRINAARRALEQRADLDTVIDRFRFYDLSHFNRRFKAIYGTTPAAFRRQVIGSQA